MPDKIDSRELYSLIRESVRANTTNAETTKVMAEATNELKTKMFQMNDNFVLHNLTQDSMSSEITFVKKQLLKWIFVSILVIFTLLGGIVITKSLGLDIVDVINN